VLRGGDDNVRTNFRNRIEYFSQLCVNMSLSLTALLTFSYYVTNNFALFFTCGNSKLRVVKTFNPPRIFYFGGILGRIKIRCELFKTLY